VQSIRSVTNHRDDRLICENKEEKFKGETPLFFDHEIAEKGGAMKIIAILALLTLGVMTTAGCHHHWEQRRNDYSDSDRRR
jgi:hypothetical protein